MRNRNYFYQPRKRVSSPLATGGSMDFYEPDSLLSEQMTPKQALPQEIAIRETAWSYYRVLGYLPNPSEVLRRMGKDIAEFKYLLEDARINGVFSSRKAGTTSQQLVVDQGETPVRQYNVIKDLFDSLDTRTIIHGMLDAVWFGYEPTEVVWKKTGGLILPEKIVPKDPDWFRFSDTNELRYLTKRNMVTGEPVPPLKFLLPTYRASYERPYGQPLASSCYWAAKFRHTGFRFLTLFVEKYGMPWVKATYPLGTQAQRVREMVDVLNDTIQDGVIAWPSEFNVEAVDMNKTASSDVFKAFIELANEEITISILGQNLTTSVKDKGSYAASKTHSEVKESIVDDDCHMVETAFNTLIDWIYILNWDADSAKPRIKLVSDQTPGKEDGDLAVALSQAGAHYTKEYFINHFHLLETEFEVGAPIKLDENGQPVPTAVQGAPVNKPEGPDTKGLAETTHDAKDPARNESTISSTKDAVNNLTRR